jgi:UDP-N-acetylmuramyl pentapeptide phosphotransferase/UDP-N-acetylglucosamine-1-phosphate transferase
MFEQPIGRFWVLGLAAISALALSWGLIRLLRPFLLRHALARPNARSSHREPTPQGGGIAVVAATLVVVWCAAVISPHSIEYQLPSFLALTAATVLMAVVGAVDDIRPLPATARLLAQSLAVGTLVAMLPDQVKILPHVPWWAERVCLLIGGIWFVNLVNFMDGIDWMTVAELVPVTGALVLIGLFGGIGIGPTILAAALFGAIVGFAPFNKPVAMLFLGDVGSLPVGLLLGWLLLELAANGYLVAALILPLYYLTDATVTLARRIARGEPFWQAHRTHFYQRATDRGLTVLEVITRIFMANVALAALALASVAASSSAVSFAAAAVAMILVIWLLLNLTRRR